MDFLWDQPYFFLILCLGLSFWIRSAGVFSEVHHKHNFAVFLGEQCTPAQRREVLRALLLSVPGDHAAFRWLVMFAMIQAGGAGCLVWYLAYTLLMLRPLGALAALRSYYQGPDGGPLNLGRLLELMLQRKESAARPLLCRALSVLHYLLLGCVLPFLAAPLLGFRGYLPAGGQPWLLVPALLAGAACLLFRRRGRAAASILFLLFLLLALLGNLASLIPVIELSLLDSVQLSSFLSALTGAGLMAVLQGGARLGAGTALLHGCAAPGELPRFPHPVFCSVYVQLRACLQMVLQTAVGLLFLCARLVPQDNDWVLTGLAGFLCLFTLLDLERAVRNFLRSTGKGQVLAALCLSCALLLWDFYTAAGLFPLLGWGVCWLSTIAVAGILAADGNWYTILLEDYRDVYIWHVQPHPSIRPYYRRP